MSRVSTNQLPYGTDSRATVPYKLSKAAFGSRSMILNDVLVSQLPRLFHFVFGDDLRTLRRIAKSIGHQLFNIDSLVKRDVPERHPILCEIVVVDYKQLRWNVFICSTLVAVAAEFQHDLPCTKPLAAT